jgi:hypothetical protein
MFVLGQCSVASRGTKFQVAKKEATKTALSAVLAAMCFLNLIIKDNSLAMTN